MRGSRESASETCDQNNREQVHANDGQAGIQQHGGYVPDTGAAVKQNRRSYDCRGTFPWRKGSGCKARSRARALLKRRRTPLGMVGGEGPFLGGFREGAVVLIRDFRVFTAVFGVDFVGFGDREFVVRARNGSERTGDACTGREESDDGGADLGAERGGARRPNSDRAAPPA